MNNIAKLLLTLLVAPLLLGACGGSKKQQSKEASPAVESFTFPTPPALIKEVDKRADYIITHVFDGVEQIDTTHFATNEAREEFFSTLFGIATNASEKGQRQLMSRYYQLATPRMDSVAVSLVEKYLDNPNSPIYDEGTYIVFTEEANNAGLLNEAEQIRLADRKLLYSRNKVGEPAEDFPFVLASGKQTTLYKSTSDKLTLLLFYDPDCGTCKNVIAYMSVNEVLKKAVKKGLRVLCVYPFDNEESWQSHLNALPKYAQVGMDKEGVVNHESLYDLRAMPTLYLLDSTKHVLLKDAFIDQIEEYLTNNILNR